MNILHQGSFGLHFWGKKSSCLKPCFQILAWHLESHPSQCHMKLRSRLDLIPWKIQFTSCSPLTDIRSAHMLISRLETSIDVQETNMGIIKSAVQRESCQTQPDSILVTALMLFARRTNRYKIKNFSLFIGSTYPSFSSSVRLPVTGMPFY